MTPHSIRGRLIRRLLLALVVVALAANVLLYFYIRHEIIEQYDEALLTEARAVASVWHDNTDRDEQLRSIAHHFPQLRLDQSEGDFLKIVDRNEAVVFHAPDRANNEWKSLKLIESGKRKRVYDLVLPDGRWGRAVEIGINHARPPEKSATLANAEYRLMLAEGSEELVETLTHLALGLAAISGTLATISIVIVVTSVSREMRPLNDFSESVKTLDADSLGFRFPTDRLASELQPISTRLNDMLARLQKSFARERRFAENVAHELRTPLTELRSLVEVAVKWPPEPEELPSHHNSVLMITQRMTGIVQRLLALIRSDPTRLITALEPTDLIQLLHIAWKSQEALARQRRIDIQFETPEQVIITTDSSVLLSLLENLFCNAASYATPDTTITCRVEADRTLKCTLTNFTDELLDEDLEHLEEPFWRKEAARSSREHSGLGLTLVREYSMALKIKCRYFKPSRERFSVELEWQTDPTRVDFEMPNLNGLSSQNAI